MSEEKLSDDFKILGENLAEMLRAAWDRPERKAVKTEIERGLNEVGKALNGAIDEFSASDVGQKIKSEANDIKSRVQSGEVEEALRTDVRSALQSVNKELEKLIQKIRVVEEKEKTEP